MYVTVIQDYGLPTDGRTDGSCPHRPATNRNDDTNRAPALLRC